MKKRVVLLGDSLGMPRPMGGVGYEDTYPYLLARSRDDIEIIPKFRRANDTDKQASTQQINDDISWLNPDIVCIHLGIVDCAPRLLGRLENSVVSRLPSSIRSKLLRFLSERRAWITKVRPKVYVPKDRFEKNLKIILDSVHGCGARSIIVGIMMPPEKLCQRSYGFKENVEAYNKILARLSIEFKTTFLDVNEFLEPEKHLCDDGIHFNKAGHAGLAKKLLKYL